MTTFNILEQREQIKQFILKLPKNDIHLHLDGSIRLETIIDLAKQNNIELPSYSVSGLEETIFKDSYENLEEYLKTFGVSLLVMQDPESIERISYELAIDNQNEGVRYIEIRFAPQLMMNAKQNMKEVLTAVNKGLNRAKREFNHKIIDNNEPPFEYSIIVCALRHFGPWSEYYAKLYDCLPNSSSQFICQIGSLELAKNIVQLRNETDMPIVAFDLAGAEAGHPAEEHQEAFQYAHKNFMFKTVHAGEAFGAESIFQAITKLHANRIGHGYFLFNPDKVTVRKIEDKEKYIQNLIEIINANRITIEVCLSSNLQTNPTIQKIQNHNFKKMLENKMSVALCTDNRTVSKTTVTDEILLALEGFEITHKDLKNIIIYGFKRSFFPHPYKEKRAYVRQCINYYEKIYKQCFDTTL